MLQRTRLGKAVLEGAGSMLEVGRGYYGGEEWRQAEMIMISKQGQDDGKVKEWRPIVLTNTVGKLADKVVAEVQCTRKTFSRQRVFAGRKGKGEIDSVMLMEVLRKGMGGKVYGRDIKSAFNSMDRDIMYEALVDHDGYREYVDYFSRPRTFDIKMNGRLSRRTTMVKGTP